VYASLCSSARFFAESTSVFGLTEIREKGERVGEGVNFVLGYAEKIAQTELYFGKKRMFKNSYRRASHNDNYYVT
jgi:hypothetical protein